MFCTGVRSALDMERWGYQNTYSCMLERAAIDEGCNAFVVYAVGAYCCPQKLNGLREEQLNLNLSVGVVVLCAPAAILVFCCRFSGIAVQNVHAS